MGLTFPGLVGEGAGGDEVGGGGVQQEGRYIGSRETFVGR
jgi:hypothetical protein